MSFDPSDSVDKRVAFYQEKADFQQAEIEEYTRPLRSLLVARGLLLLTLMISGLLTLVTHWLRLLLLRELLELLLLLLLQLLA